MLLGGLQTQEANHFDFVFAWKGITERSFLEIDLVTKERDWDRHLKAEWQIQKVKGKIKLEGGKSGVANPFDLDFACV